jgi:hypothetical protein
MIRKVNHQLKKKTYNKNQKKLKLILFNWVQMTIRADYNKN